MYINVIMKTMCPTGYPHNDSVAPLAPGNLMYGCLSCHRVVTSVSK